MSNTIKTAIKTAIGTMSGTSRDGVDVALIKSDGEGHIICGGALSYPYDADMQKEITYLCHASRYHHKELRPTLDNKLSMTHEKAISALLRQEKLTPSDIDIVGFHGQTLFHDPAQKITVQAGNPALLAEKTGIDVVFDFRANDIAMGGEGAPLVAIYHRALFSAEEKPLVIVNIGGIANLTLLGKTHFLSFDTGPGCGLSNDWVVAQGKGGYDHDGAYAQKGQINEARLALLLDKINVSVQPHSFDRTDFGIEALTGLSLEDGAALAEALCARAIARACLALPEKPLLCLLCGGGRKNLFIFKMLKEYLGIPVKQVDFKNYDGDMIEAQAFGYLALRSLLGKPLSYPETTGVSKPALGGVLFPTRTQATKR